MTRQRSGPRRARSVQSYLRQTRAMAILALSAFAGGVASDFTSGGFWEHHNLLSGLVASVIVVMLSVAVVNEVLERRRRQRWSVLAQYVMLGLVRNARMTWTGFLELAGLLPPKMNQQEVIDAGIQVVHDTARLTAAIRAVVEDDVRRAQLQTEVAFLADHSNEVLGRWAAVMLNAEMYAEIFDRHVELAGDIAWIGDLLDSADPPDDLRRRKRARGSAAAIIWNEVDAGWLAERIVVIIQLAESLDRGTLDIALRIVPVEWWQARLTPGAPAASAPDVVG
jgi:hypothetical protein